METLSGPEPALPADPATIRGPRAPDVALAAPRRRLAQLIGRLLARQWLRDRQGQRPGHRDPDRPPRGRSARATR